MALDRQSIEKKDFPIGRRGYDPAAVDAHLSALADEIDELKRSSRRRNESLAVSASEQVRAIVEAAETSAEEIQRQAEEAARDIRAEAGGEAEAARRHASTQARDYVGKVSESASGMLQRLDAMESELSALFETLKTGSSRMSGDLQLLQSSLEEVREAVTPRPTFEREVRPVEARVAEAPLASADADELGPTEPRPAEAALVEAEAAVTEDEPGLAEEPLAGEAAPEPAVALAAEAANGAGGEAANGSDDNEGARLIALNMALDGTPREETDRYLAENFRLSDRGRLLDEVYASVEG